MTATISRRRTIQLTGGAVFAAALPAYARSREFSQREFDCIIVGAGSAGCVLAARLSENPNRRVLLLEAGPASADPLIDDPKKWFQLLFGDYVWNDDGVPQTHAENRSIDQIHGKIVGGSSAINATIHHRPTRDDIDQWNLENWGWDDLMPLFLKSEEFLGGAGELRGRKGPIKVMRLPDPPALAQATLGAASRLGYGVSDDINGASQVGAAINQFAFDGEKRQHTGYAYLWPAMDRPNLFVETGAQVTGLVFDGSACVGANYRVGDEEKSVEAGQVILSAGALRSPAMLMLSGIGPADHLRSLDIPVRADSPDVGSNLHDHILVAGHNFATQTPVADSALHGSVAIVYGASELSGGSRDLMLNVSTSSRIAAALENPAQGFKTTFSFMKPESRGTLRLSTRNPFAQPIIDHNIFSTQNDMRGAIAALSLSREILGAREFERFGGVEQNADLLKDEAGMRELIVKGATMFGHHCGTCRMGVDEGAVVDAALKVQGVSGLLVVDASIVPSIPSCPTNALVVAMAETAAARITQ